ncbi:MAG: hypothetical protein SF182_17015 [Deltaproteobacteria bacterium]|nr:hypothetical protein [Deltaproteobacteria bacterium]
MNLRAAPLYPSDDRPLAASPARVVGRALAMAVRTVAFVALVSTLSFVSCSALHVALAGLASPDSIGTLVDFLRSADFSTPYLEWHAALIGLGLTSGLALYDWECGRRTPWREATAVAVGLGGGAWIYVLARQGATLVNVLIVVTAVAARCVMMARRPRRNARDLLFAAVCGIGLAGAVFVTWILTIWWQLA